MEPNFITMSNPYLEFARFHKVDYGNVLSYSDAVWKELLTFWELKACDELSGHIQMKIIKLKAALRKHYGVKS